MGKYLGYFIILNFQSSTFKRPGNENTRRDHFLYIDEFQSYANPGFADMLTQGRSYRVASHLATQNRALIGMGSGKDGEDFIELVSTNARNIVLFPGGNFMDAKYYSDQFGEVEKITIGESTAVSAGSPIMTQGRQPTKDTFQIKEDMEARMSPTDIILREFGEITFSIVKNNTLQPARIGRISYIDKDLNQTLDQMIDENNKMMLVGLDPNEYRDFNNHGALKKDLLNWDLLLRDCDSIAEEERQDSLRVAREKNVRLNRYDVGGDPNVWPGEDLDEKKKKENAEQNSLASRGSDDGESNERGRPIFAEEVKRSTERKEGGSGDPSQIVTKQDLEDACLS